ncbi:MAG: V-type ATP synthase subunit D [Clostridiales bacterium]|nr:V-type ATP synthase subunit D [Clostridiales bacterium]MDD6261409.1 V-type ATP synthase subunit D [Clostridiales bacterium]MDD7594789.1 V-type ATP synthase subunit D [Clostridiales bacterium]MDY5861024.1 V-type ATP synthase subunit D [Eubacteriales bacterium]
MAGINVSPTRMELKKLKNRYAAARRGHKLLKDKRDELMKHFLDTVRENEELREKVEKKLRAYYRSFTAAGAVGNPRMLEEALITSSGENLINMELSRTMGVTVPVLEGGDITVGIGYGMAFTPAGLDAALEELSQLSADMIKLAELEKTAQLLAGEIERTRRRVNALEYILMPRYLESIKIISMKLDEDERGSRARLMKVKEMAAETERKQKRAEMFGEDAG